MNISDLKDRYKLAPDIFKQIQELIISIYTNNVSSPEIPTAIILGGQPGAGKGELITIAQKMMSDNLVVCNADDYRDFHPAADEIKSRYEIEYPEITVEYSQPWNNGLRAYCEANRLNYVMETTFSSGERMNDTIRQIKDSGYRVVILLLAVNERFSLLGTYLRYEEMKATTGYGRRVNKKIHDDKYNLIPETLKAVQQFKLYDELFIYGRNQYEENQIKAGIQLIASNPDDPLSAYFLERDKSWSVRTKNYFDDCCQKIALMMNSKKDKFRKNQFLKSVGMKAKK